MQEIERTLANPNTPYYHTLMTGLFQQSVELHQDYTYDVGASTPATQGLGLFSKEKAYFRMRLADLTHKVCRRHGMLQMTTAL
jgi:translation initiation factor 2-alpha kinase 4